MMPLQVQPAPAIETSVKPAGTAYVTVTTPAVAAKAEFETLIA